MSWGQNFTVVKRHGSKCCGRKTLQQTEHWVDVPCGSKCRAVILWVDVSSRQPLETILYHQLKLPSVFCPSEPLEGRDKQPCGEVAA
jgi:hypothetical protein